jgi:hypothetical protein
LAPVELRANGVFVQYFVNYFLAHLSVEEVAKVHTYKVFFLISKENPGELQIIEHRL